MIEMDEVTIAAGLALLSGFGGAYEAALLSVSRSRLEELLQEQAGGKPHPMAPFVKSIIEGRESVRLSSALLHAIMFCGFLFYAWAVWAQGKSMRVGFPALGRQGGRPQALAIEAVESMVDFLRSGASLPASLAAFLLAPLARAAGTSRLTVDRATIPLKAAVEAVQAMYPGAVRLIQARQQGLPWELSIQGQDRA